MKYLKTFESNSHWTESLFDKVKFDKVDEIKELTYTFLDEFDMRSDVSFSFKKNGFDSPGRIQEYLLDEINLYKSYFVQIHAYNGNPLDIDKLLLFKECEIEIINRLRDIGYIFKYSTGSNNYINIELYHPDNIVDKDLFLKSFKKTRSRSIGELYQYLVKNFGKISNISKTVSDTIIMDIDPSTKYTINDLLIFVKTSLKHTKGIFAAYQMNLSIELVNKYKDNKDIFSIEIKIKK